MSRRAIIFPVLLALLAGCQSAATPSGRAALRLYVFAEPKTGVRPAPRFVSVYDSSADGAYAPATAYDSDYEKVDYSALSDIVVWLEPVNATAGGGAAPADAAVEVDPDKPADGIAAAACVGQRIVFHNGGANPADVYSVSDNNQFDLGTLAPGSGAVYTVRGSGLIEVLSSLIEEPIADVYAAPSPWFGLTRSGRIVEFDDLPAGQYKIISWHPRLPGQEKTADLPPDRVVTASIKVSVNGLPPAAQP